MTELQMLIIKIIVCVAVVVTSTILVAYGFYTQYIDKIRE